MGLGIHPFNQPDVQAAKDATEAVLAERSARGRLPEAESLPADPRTFLSFLAQHAQPGGYVALQAYLPPDPRAEQALRRLQGLVRDRFGLACTGGFGPRYLHSTGQFHKGGPPTGTFVQFLDHPRGDLPVPGEAYSFAELLAAQAIGDWRALKARGRPVLRLCVADFPSFVEQVAAARQGGAWA
jgi:hypothetical protein